MSSPYMALLGHSACSWAVAGKDNYVMEEIGIGTERERGEEKEKGG